MFCQNFTNKTAIWKLLELSSQHYAPFRCQSYVDDDFYLQTIEPTFSNLHHPLIWHPLSYNIFEKLHRGTVITAPPPSTWDWRVGLSDLKTW